MDRQYIVDVTDKADVTRVITELNDLVKKPKNFLDEARTGEFNYECGIEIVDANGNDCYDAFVAALSSFKLKAKMKGFVTKVLKLRFAVLESMEMSFGLKIFREYACYDAEGIDYYDQYVSYIDVDHDVYVFEFFFDILEVHGWTLATTELYATFIGEGCQEAHESFPLSSLQSYFTTQKSWRNFYNQLRKADRHNFHTEEIEQWERGMGIALGFVDPRAGEDRPEFADYETEESFPLVQALTLPDDEFVAALREHGDAVNKQYIHMKAAKRTVLMAALEMVEPSVEKITALIEQGAQVNLPEERLWNGEWERGNTPFLEAIARTQPSRAAGKEAKRANEKINIYREVVSYMIAHGAELAPAEGYNPLLVALEAGDAATLKLLVSAFDYDVNEPESAGEPLVFHGAEHLASLQYLWKLGADFNAVNSAGDSLLFAVIRYLDFNTLIYMVSRGVDVSFTNPAGDDVFAVLDQSLARGVEREIKQYKLESAYKYNLKPLLKNKFVKKVITKQYELESLHALPGAVDELIALLQDQKEFFKSAKIAKDKFSFKPIFTVDGRELREPYAALVEMGEKQKLLELFTALTALQNPIYDSKASVWGTDMIPLLFMEDEENHPLLVEYIRGANPRGLRVDYYDNREPIIAVMTNFPSDLLLSQTLDEYEATLYPKDLLPVMGTEGEVYDRFWKMYEAKHGAEETESNKSYYDSHCWYILQYGE